jgi:hypothetical protein
VPLHQAQIIGEDLHRENIQAWAAVNKAEVHHHQYQETGMFKSFTRNYVRSNKKISLSYANLSQRQSTKRLRAFTLTRQLKLSNCKIPLPTNVYHSLELL